LIRQPPPITEGTRVMRLSQIQEQVGRGEYQVDTHAVADAIVRRLLEEHKIVASGHKRAQGECS
jgi:Anti-sigma-28 factor, FlgM